MPLKVIITAVAARLTDVEVHVRDADGQTMQIVGDKRARQRGTPPRVTWVPAGEPLQPIIYRGGAAGALWLRESRWDLQLWARSAAPGAQLLDHLEAAEALLATVVQAIHAELTRGGYRLDGAGRWELGDQAGMETGVVYVLPLVLLIPITRATPGTAIVHELDETMAVAGGSTSHVQQVP